MIVAVILVLVLMTVAGLGAWALCKATATKAEERILEDKEQMEYLRKWREKYEKRI